MAYFYGIIKGTKGGIRMDYDYLKQKRILLVDDEQELLDMVVSKILKRQKQ